MSLPMRNDVWVEHYRPQTVEECILPKDIKERLNQFVIDQDTPNLLLCGSAGCGKTTVAKALCRQLDFDFVFISASLDNGVDVLRDRITRFISAKSLTSNKKAVILDEADFLTPNAQAALRNVMENFSSNAVFFLTCNYHNKIIEAVSSRCTTVEFHFPKEEKQQLIVDYTKSIIKILKEQKVEFDKQILLRHVNNKFPDLRKILNDIQGHIVDSELSAAIANQIEDFDSLWKCIKKKDFNGIRHWVEDNYNGDAQHIYSALYKYLNDKEVTKQHWMVVACLAEYQYKTAFVKDHQLNLTACLVEMMSMLDE